MAQLPDSSKIHVTFQPLKSAVAADSGGDLWKEAIHIAPEVLWIVFAFVFLILFYKPLRDLIPKIDGFEFKGMKLSFLRESLDGVMKVSMAVNATDQNRQGVKWNTQLPEKEKLRALKRAVDNRKLLSGTRLLWVDDQPEYGNNERRMLQQLGVYCDIVRCTMDAMVYINDYDYDCIISDMVRENDSDFAGIDLIARLRESNIKIPVILYVGYYDNSRPTPTGAFGITNRPDQFLHLLIDALGRTRKDC